MSAMILAVMLALLWVPRQAPTPAPARAKADAPPLLDINHASAQDFEKLPGIGPKLAESIVTFRRKHGPFRRVEDLMAIKGLGLKKWRAIRPYLRVGAPPGKGSK